MTVVKIRENGGKIGDYNGAILTIKQRGLRQPFRPRFLVDQDGVMIGYSGRFVIFWRFI